MLERTLKSVGLLRYSVNQGKYSLVVDVDSGIVNLARALIPSYIKLNRQKYSPHITVVRNEIPPNLDKWGLYDGKEIEFEYSSFVKSGLIYWWLNAYCDELRKIRVEQGLPPTSELTRPPDDADCFHITIGNTKGIK